MFAHCAHGIPSTVAQNRNMLGIVSEDDTVRSSLGDLLESYQFEVRRYPSLEDFIETAAEPVSACLIVDLPSGHDRSVDTLRMLRTELPQSATVILLTGRSDRQTRDRVRKSGVACQLEKPVDSEWLVAMVRALVSRVSASLDVDRERSVRHPGAGVLRDHRPVCEADR